MNVRASIITVEALSIDLSASITVRSLHKCKSKVWKLCIVLLHMEVVHMEVWKLCIVLLCMTRAPYDINSSLCY